MLAYIVRRLLLMIPTLLGIMIINFAIVKLAPGGPLEQIVAENDIVLTAIGDCCSCCSCCIRDAISLEDAGIPTVVCGPGGIDQAHKPNEFVSLDQIDKCHVFFDKLMDHVCK